MDGWIGKQMKFLCGGGIRETARRWRWKQLKYVHQNYMTCTSINNQKTYGNPKMMTDCTIQPTIKMMNPRLMAVAVFEMKAERMNAIPVMAHCKVKEKKVRQN
jgi:hypothetical protein